MMAKKQKIVILQRDEDDLLDTDEVKEPAAGPAGKTEASLAKEQVQPKDVKVFLRTFGCQMNERDSEIIAGLLMDHGFGVAESQDEAEVVLFNTCSVREHAEERVAGNIEKLSSLKDKKPGKMIGILGCMSQRHGESLFSRFPSLDMVVGPGNIYDMPELLREALDGKKVLAVDKLKRPKKGTDPAYRSGVFSAYVNVMYGCDNYCSYCIVPYVRGREVSRPKKDIVKEVKSLADAGFKEVILLGQNVNSYGKGQTQKVDFPEILEAVNDIKGIERIRFTTSHPKDAGKPLFKAMRDLPKVCEHMHMCLQSGSNKILDLMNRKYTLDEYMKKVDTLREMVPGVGISTDILVGFPSEKESDYVATRMAMEDIKFNSSFIFKYSPRPPALSSTLIDDVPEKIKVERNRELLEIQKEISYEINKKMVSSSQEVLVEGPSRMSKDELVGKTRDNTSCVFKGPSDLIGKVVKVTVKGTSPFTLKSELET
ncbi:MAG: tRNA (N6-isopentenyl adenosine(37)-C2)-methylthiotransferase MiaB [Candidatus Omnitrophica bacterium]|nr:tRNA (N6-isopentenyl adenosine(37)-C2)-methylthiotransferase MiaB [Candidatus Omnitrophota bacterium]